MVRLKEQTNIFKDKETYKIQSHRKTPYIESSQELTAEAIQSGKVTTSTYTRVWLGACSEQLDNIH